MKLANIVALMIFMMLLLRIEHVNNVLGLFADDIFKLFCVNLFGLLPHSLLKVLYMNISSV